MRLHKAHESAAFIRVDIVEVLLLLWVIAVTAEAVYFCDTLLELLPEHVHHRLLDLMVHLEVLEEGYGGEHLGQGLQTRSEHDDDLYHVHLGLVPQVEQDDH